MLKSRAYISVVLETLRPFIIKKCLEIDNYLITDKQALNLANIIIKQADSLNALEDVLKRTGYIK